MQATSAVELETKKCAKCGETKSVSEFYRHYQMKFGYLSKCKTCTKRDVLENRAKNIEHYRAFDKARAMLPHRVAARADYIRTPDGRAAEKRAKAKFIRNNPGKRAAHVLVGNALRDGRLVKGACEVCGAGKAHGHHDDYNKPLEVRWLCTKHHAEWHKHNTPIPPSPIS